MARANTIQHATAKPRKQLTCWPTHRKQNAKIAFETGNPSTRKRRRRSLQQRRMRYQPLDVGASTLVGSFVLNRLPQPLHRKLNVRRLQQPPAFDLGLISVFRKFFGNTLWPACGRPIVAGLNPLLDRRGKSCLSRTSPRGEDNSSLGDWL
jgi:hypothetical protein